jgi:hypothetical protein
MTWQQHLSRDAQLIVAGIEARIKVEQQNEGRSTLAWCRLETLESVLAMAEQVTKNTSKEQANA